MIEQRIVIILLFLFMLAGMGFITGCKQSTIVDSDLPPESAINVRIQNENEKILQALYLGSGLKNNTPSTHQTGFRQIAPNTVTAYAQIEPNINNYNVSSVRYDGQLYINRTNPAAFLGLSELKVGAYYTLKYSIVDGDTVLSVVQDN